MIVYNYDADLEVSDTCVRSSLLSWVELSDNRGISLSDWRFVVQMLTCWSCRYGVLPSVVDFFALSHFSVCFYVWINSCNKLDLLVNDGISLVLVKMRNCVMQNTNGKMQNEKMWNDGDWSTRQTTWLQLLQSWPRGSIRCWHWIQHCSAQILLVSVVFAMVLRLSVIGLFIFCCHKPIFYRSGWSDHPFCIDARLH